MSTTNQNSQEERALLLEFEENYKNSEQASYSGFETAIAKGVTKHVGKWPSHLFAVFLAASLVFATFMLFALVATLFCMPTDSHRSPSKEFMELPNIYFVKHANRTWSDKDLCYIETSARDYPEINVYLINLLSPTKLVIVEDTKNIEISQNGDNLFKRLDLWEQANNSINNSIALPSNITKESRMRKKLAGHYANVRNIDIAIDKFFKGSMLSYIYHKLDVRTLEIAGKAHLLWNIPGVGLDPPNFRRLHRLQTYLSRKEFETGKVATITMDGRLQASGVTCQAFIGCLINEIAKCDAINDPNVVQKSRDSFCQRRHKCPGVDILIEDSSYLHRLPYCPTIYPLEISSPVKDNNISIQSAVHDIFMIAKQHQKQKRIRHVR